MSLQNDAFGRVVTLVTSGGQDNYTADDGHGNILQVSFPQGTSLVRVYSSLSSQTPISYIPPSVPLQSQYTPQAYGLLAIATFVTQPGLTPAQRKTLATNAGPYVSLVLVGDISGLLALSSSIPVDGVLITNQMITVFQAALNSYLSGS